VLLDHKFNDLTILYTVQLHPDKIRLSRTLRVGACLHGSILQPREEAGQLQLLFPSGENYENYISAAKGGTEFAVTPLAPDAGRRRSVPLTVPNVCELPYNTVHAYSSSNGTHEHIKNLSGQFAPVLQPQYLRDLRFFVVIRIE